MVATESAIVIPALTPATDFLAAKSAEGVFTPERLLEIAQIAEMRYQQLSILFPPGTFHDERNDSRRVMEDALIAAAWMETNGFAELKFVGSFGPVPFSRREFHVPLERRPQVRIPKGAMVHENHIGGPGSAAKTSYTVRLHSFDEGWINHFPDRRDDTMVRNPGVSWAGTGGKWRYAAMSDVVFLP